MHSKLELPKAFSVRDKHEFLPIRHLMARLNPQLFVSLVLAINFACSAPASEGNVSPAVKDDAGILVHIVRSEYQSTPTKIRVLLPKDASTRHHVLYVLPVEPLDGVRWGDGLEEVKNHGLHDKYGLICVQPTFSEMPWYADHPTKATLRQETHFLKVVVPFIDRTYPTMAGKEGRLLLGFSKSGCGAFSLLLRHPEVFDKAVAWDAPLMMERPDKYKMADIFGSKENFEKYRIAALLEKQAVNLSGPVRLLHFGYGNFREHHQSAHKLMEELKIAHQYRDGPKRKHSWHSGWLPEAVQMLVDSPARSSTELTLADALAVIKSRQFVDLTHAFEPGIPHWPGFPEEKRETLYWYDGGKGTRGKGFFAQQYTHVGQWGTHCDPPAHFVKGKRTIDQIDPKEMILPLVVIDVHEQAAKNRDYTISMDDVRAWERRHGPIPEGAFVAMRTDWSKRWPDAIYQRRTTRRSWRWRRTAGSWVTVCRCSWQAATR
jgi:kynurenine formamidase